MYLFSNSKSISQSLHAPKSHFDHVHIKNFPLQSQRKHFITPIYDLHLTKTQPISPIFGKIQRAFCTEVTANALVKPTIPKGNIIDVVPVVSKQKTQKSLQNQYVRIGLSHDILYRI
jgi:hypothetical protein